MHEAESESDHPAPAYIASDDVLQRHIKDGHGDQRFDQRRKPQSIRPEVERGGNQRDRMRDGERRDDRDQGTEAPERNDQAEEKQQMVRPIQDMVEAEL